MAARADVPAKEKTPPGAEPRMSEVQTTIGLGTGLMLAVGLAMDATAVAAGISASLPVVTRRHAFRLSYHFGLFQFLMPILGWLLGGQMVRYIDGYDHWVAFGLLALVGGHMVYEAIRSGQGKAAPAEAAASGERKDPTRGWSLVVLSVGTSLDALAVGMSLALTQTSPWTVALVIGLVTAGLVLVGMRAGRIAGALFGRVAEVAGGLVLVLIGVRILMQGLGTGT
jgi:putative Mn2+ efflux pump MntP